mmetsp:Transcript_35414/g.75613  ORF Transcript_35414/g.75613 Transcript_35414/m.75613 type:complete len:294 (-) Transcript_35414:180-1061(-)
MGVDALHLVLIVRPPEEFHHLGVGEGPVSPPVQEFLGYEPHVVLAPQALVVLVRELHPHEPVAEPFRHDLEPRRRRRAVIPHAPLVDVVRMGAVELMPGERGGDVGVELHHDDLRLIPPHAQDGRHQVGVEAVDVHLQNVGVLPRVAVFQLLQDGVRRDEAPGYEHPLRVRYGGDVRVQVRLHPLEALEQYPLVSGHEEVVRGVVGLAVLRADVDEVIAALDVEDVFFQQRLEGQVGVGLHAGRGETRFVGDVGDGGSGRLFGRNRFRRFPRFPLDGSRIREVYDRLEVAAFF